MLCALVTVIAWLLAAVVAAIVIGAMVVAVAGFMVLCDEVGEWILGNSSPVYHG